MTAGGPAKPPFALLVLVTLSGTMALHMVLPALPSAARGLGVQAAHLQLAVSFYVVGLAGGQLVYGPLSDARGRRPLLLLGLGFYTLGGIVSAFAPSLPVLLAARLVQGFGGCAGLALGRAMVRDTSDTRDAIGRLASLNLAIVLGPALAPMVGGALAASLGWRSVFHALALTGAVTWWLAWKAVPETTTPAGRIALRGVAADAGQLLANPRFTALALGGGIFTTALWGFLTSAPFILTQQLGQPVEAIGLYSGVIVLGAGAGNAMTSRLVRRIEGERLVFAGVATSLVAALVLLALVLPHRLGAGGLVATLLLFTCGTGLANPVVVTRALGIVPRLTGSAAGLYGFVQMLMGAAITTLATLGRDPSLTAALLLLGATLVAGSCMVFALRPEAA